MKNLIRLLFILTTLFSCSKSNMEFDPERPILGKWELKIPINANTTLNAVQHQFFIFKTSNLGIRGIILNKMWESYPMGWSEKITTNHKYSLSDDNKILYINYEDDLLDFDILELNEHTLILKPRSNNYRTHEFSRAK